MFLGIEDLDNMGSDCPDIKVGCFLGIRSEQLQRVIVKRDFGDPNSVVIHVGTNDIKRTRNLDYVMGDIYNLINMAKSRFTSSRVILSGVLRRRDISWRRTAAANNRLEWVANSLGVTFVDPNCWVDDWDLSGDGLHLNRRAARHLGQLFARVCGVGGGGQESWDS